MSDLTQNINIGNENTVNEESDDQQTNLSPLNSNGTIVKKWTKKKKAIVFSILTVASLITILVVLYTCNHSFERLINVYCFNDCLSTIFLADHYAESDWKKSADLYERAIKLAENNDSYSYLAYFRYAEMLLKQKKHSFAIYICKRALEYSKNGFGEGIYEIMAKAYEGEKNYTSAFEYYNKALHNSTILMQKHILLTKEEKKAAEERVAEERAAEEKKGRIYYSFDDDSIIFKIALWYTYGQGCKKDLAKAANLWTYLANRNNYSAMYNLGLCYLRGEGVTRNNQTAFNLFKEAADNGNKGAMKLLSQCYGYGLGCDIDTSAASYWKDLAEK